MKARDRLEHVVEPAVQHGGQAAMAMVGAGATTQEVGDRLRHVVSLEVAVQMEGGRVREHDGIAGQDALLTQRAGGTQLRVGVDRPPPCPPAVAAAGGIRLVDVRVSVEAQCARPVLRRNDDEKAFALRPARHRPRRALGR